MKLKKLFLTILIIAGVITTGSFLFTPQVSLANYGLDDAAQKAGLTGEKNALANVSPMQVVGRVIQAGLSLVGIVFFILMIYAGIYWMLARGDAGKVDKAKEIMESAIVGLIIVVSAYALVNFMFNNFIGVATPTPAQQPAPAQQ